MSDRAEITALVHAYARRLDAGDLDGVAALFEHATWRSESTGEVLRGTEIRAVYERVRLYDGSPRTKHLITNLSIEVEPDAEPCGGRVLLHGAPRRGRGRADTDHSLRSVRRPVREAGRAVALLGPLVHRRPHRGSREALRVKFGFAVPAYGENAQGPAIRDLLVAGDELGFDSAWFPDHIAVPDYAARNVSPPFLEPVAACAWGLGLTSNLRMGTDVLVAPYRHPLLVAATMGTLGRLAGDRLILGVGVGYLKGEFEVLGAPPYERRGEVTEEILRILRSPPEGYAVVSSPMPVPIWVGGNAVRAQRRAALLGDGWHPLWMPDQSYAEARRYIVEERARANLGGPFTFSYSCPATRLLARRPVSWPRPAARAPRGSEFRYAPEAWVDEENRPRFTGTADQLIADFRLLEAVGVDTVTLRFGTNDVRQLESFARDVRPAFES